MGTWRASFRKGSDWARHMHPEVYNAYQQAVMTRLLARSEVYVAAAADDVTLYGYLVVEKGVTDRPVVHYLYVKEPFRTLKVATRLMAAAGIDPYRLYFTHLTRDRRDLTPGSPMYGSIRWRGAETLLRKWPVATSRYDRKSRKTVYTDGNLWLPFLT